MCVCFVWMRAKIWPHIRILSVWCAYDYYMNRPLQRSLRSSVVVQPSIIIGVSDKFSQLCSYPKNPSHSYLLYKFLIVIFWLSQVCHGKGFELEEYIDNSIYYNLIHRLSHRRIWNDPQVCIK